MTQFEKIDELIKNHNGIIRTSQVVGLFGKQLEQKKNSNNERIIELFHVN